MPVLLFSVLFIFLSLFCRKCSPVLMSSSGMAVSLCSCKEHILLSCRYLFFSSVESAVLFQSRSADVSGKLAQSLKLGRLCETVCGRRLFGFWLGGGRLSKVFCYVVASCSWCLKKNACFERFSGCCVVCCDVPFSSRDFLPSASSGSCPSNMHASLFSK